MTRTRALLLVLLLVAVAAFPVWRTLHQARMPAQAEAAEEAPQTVSDMVVAAGLWQSRLKAFGQVRAVQGADLSAQVSGIVDAIDFQSGQQVKAGTVLLRLRLYDDPAKLQQLQAMTALWSANLARDQKQFEAQAISRATLDLDSANLRSYQAQVAAQQQAMEEKIVRAPFDGRLGIRQVDLGQFLPAGTAIVSLQALDPIYVDFNVPQQQIGRIDRGQGVDVSVDAFPGRIFHATVLAIDSRIDSQSRMATVRATLANPDGALLPNMFAIAQLDQGAPHEVLSVPQAAVSFNPYGDFVYVLQPDPNHRDRLLAMSRVVVLGESQGARVVVTSGLKVGERIVTAGQMKLRNGAPVLVDNSVRPDESLSPNPPEE